MRRVILESPYAGHVKQNVDYARRCMRDCLNRGEAPFASHLLYTQPKVLDDTVPAERQYGIDAGFAWRESASATVVYTDFGISRGMEYGIEHARTLGHALEFRKLEDLWLATPGNTWLCSACGKQGYHRNDIGDECCFAHAIFVEEKSIKRNERGHVIEARSACDIP